MYEGGISIDNNSAGCCLHGRQRAPEVHCSATTIYNLGKCRLTDEFFTLNFMKFTFLSFHVIVLVKTFPLMYQLQM